MLAIFSIPGGAQSQDDIDRIREERKQNEAEIKAKAGEVDVAGAELEEVTAVLAALTSSVNAQTTRLADAERQLALAEQEALDAETAVAQGEAAIELLAQQLAERAITSFVKQGDETVLLLEIDDPNLALRMQSLVDDLTQTDVDIADRLRAAREDLAVERQRADDAAERAAELREEMAADLALLEADRELQAELTAEAEVRLDQLLSERASLQALGLQLADAEQAAVDAYAAELARRSAASPAAPSGPGGARPPVASPSEIVNVGRGIWVHESIASNVAQLLADADAAGISLAGGGYRDPEGQIRVRKSNCGTSDYAIWEMPASQCRPPTARPGSSMHERGLAIDFTYNGSIIGRRSGPAWDWLAANAANYGLYNLPSEPWHWSTNGG
jgi:LAS superfamily LD-carboxypeptidase LdcB